MYWLHILCVNVSRFGDTYRVVGGDWVSVVLMKGNEAIAEAAIRAGCQCFFCYPITPQNEISAYMAKNLSEQGGTYVQAESEVSAINMVYGAAGAGARVMTSSSGPGISLKQEGISYIAGAELPCVIVDIMRCGPGLGGILPAQSDYFQVVKGGGHGDYRVIVYAPSTVQEAADYTSKAFTIADKYRMPVIVLGDGILGQMMEPVSFHNYQTYSNIKDWATTGWDGLRERNVITSLYIRAEELEQKNKERFLKYEIIEKNETEYELYNCENAKVIIVAYGIVGRIVKSVIREMNGSEIPIGLVRPITLWPFPYDILETLAQKEETHSFLAIEMSMGQMVEDVRLGVNGLKNVHFYGRTGGVVPTPDEIIEKIKNVVSMSDC